MKLGRAAWTKVVMVSILGASSIINDLSPTHVGAAGDITIDGRYAAIGPIGHQGSIDVTVTARRRAGHRRRRRTRLVPTVGAYTTTRPI